LSDDGEPVSDEHNATYYHDRLKMLKERLGIEAPLPSSAPLTPVQNKEPEVRFWYLELVKKQKIDFGQNFFLFLFFRGNRGN